MRLEAIRQQMHQDGIDVWCCYDFRGSNAVFRQLVGTRWTTRRAMLVIDRTHAPTLIVHSIDAPQFDALDRAASKDGFLTREVYRGQADWLACVQRHVRGRRVAMEYAPGGALPAVSCVDAGTVESIVALGALPVSSMDLIQVSVARWSDEAQRLHAHAQTITQQARDAGFDLVRTRHRDGGPVTELDVLNVIRTHFAEHGLDELHPAIVGVNGHAGDPHFEVSQTDPHPIRPGDWLLIDLWARVPGESNVFADLTWVGFAGRRDEVPLRMRRVFETVRSARDAAIDLVQSRFREGVSVRGCDLDEVARRVLIEAGYADAIRHRTGHSLSPGPAIHGMGANLDCFETTDTRRILPGTGFTIEPGLYFDDFGCRLEVNLFVDEKDGPRLTCDLQDDIVELIQPSYR